MNGALFAKALREGKWLLAALCLLMFGFGWINLWVSSMISMPAFSQFLANALPQQFERLSEVPFSQLATPAGQIAAIFAHPLILLGAAIWAIARGSDVVSGEIGRGTMELLLAQPVRRLSVYATHALATVLGAALLAGALWCGIAIGLATVKLSEPVSATLFIPPAVNLFTRTVFLSGVSAMVSACFSTRWRAVGLVCAWYAVSNVLEIVGRVVEGWRWVRYLSFMSAYSPQAMVARPDRAWQVVAVHDGVFSGIGMGGQQVVLIALGLLCYTVGAVVFNRRELPAPL